MAVRLNVRFTPWTRPFASPLPPCLQLSDPILSCYYAVKDAAKRVAKVQAECKIPGVSTDGEEAVSCHPGQPCFHLPISPAQHALTA